MQSWNIFSHSVRLVFRNLRYAIPISAPVFLAALLQSVFGQGTVAPDVTNASTLIIDSNTLGREFGLGLLQFLAGLWSAVAWHRFVLLEEYPSGFLPAFHPAHMFRYFVTGLVLGLILVGLAFVALIPLMFLAGSVVSIALGVTLFLGMVVVWLRMSPVLPARAIGDGLTIKQALERTTGAVPTFLGLILLWVCIMVGLSLVFFSVSTLSFGLAVIVGVAVNWVLWMVSISTLTTLHGIYIEGRTID